MRGLGKALWAGLCALLCLTVLFPLGMLLAGSLMGGDEALKTLGPVFSGAEGYATWPLLPQYPTLRGYIELTLDSPEFFAMFWNSIVYAGLSLLGSLWAWAQPGGLRATASLSGRPSLRCTSSSCLCPFR